MVALELEVLAQKYGVFGWENNRGTAAQDRLVTDWINVLADYPLQEIRAACNLHVAENPKKMPNEGHLKEIVLRERKRKLQCAGPMQDLAPSRPSKTDEEKARVAALVAELFPKVKRFPSPYG